MDSNQFLILIGVLIGLVVSVHILMVRSFCKIHRDLEIISTDLDCINQKIGESTVRIESLVKQIHGN